MSQQLICANGGIVILTTGDAARQVPQKWLQMVGNAADTDDYLVGTVVV